MTAPTPPSDEFPCQLTLNIPLPTPTHARTALRVLAVDAELSPLVQRQLSIPAAQTPQNILRVHYAATTNRMLRVAVNGFFDSLAVVLGIMHECDDDVVMAPGGESVEGAQGVVCVEG